MEDQKNQRKAVSKDISNYRSLEAVANSAGGKVLLKGFKKDAVNAIDTLISTFKTAPEYELRATCAVLRERIMVIRAINRAPLQRKFAQKELDELSTEDIDEDEE